MTLNTEFISFKNKGFILKREARYYNEVYKKSQKLTFDKQKSILIIFRNINVPL